jgi:DNA modification methylase
MRVETIGNATLYLGDCREILPALPHVDAIVTDPPYELGFMGKSWDASGIAYDSDAWREALRVLKPGGYLLAFGGSRTYHRMACAIEDAGFEIRDQIMWLYGSGFPKSHNGEWGGTALKPAHEPIVVARKPLIGTVAANFEAHGTGALNIDGCRVESGGTHGSAARAGHGAGRATANDAGSAYGARLGGVVAEAHEGGRWPANVIHDGSDEVLAAFPDAPGQLAAESFTAPSAKTSVVYGAMKRQGEPSQDSENEGEVGFKMKPGARRLDSGSAARFFYCAKADRNDRNEGCEGMVERMPHPPSGDGRAWDIAGSRSEPRANFHPTVKPTALMRYLCRLVTPAGGIVLDPFAGSGSTGKAAVSEGFRFVGIEKQDEYFDIACKRIECAQRQGSLFDPPVSRDHAQTGVLL